MTSIVTFQKLRQKIPLLLEYLVYAIRNFVIMLFVIRYLVLFAIRYSLFGIICSNYTNTEERIFDNYIILRKIFRIL